MGRMAGVAIALALLATLAGCVTEGGSGPPRTGITYRDSRTPLTVPTSPGEAGASQAPAVPGTPAPVARPVSGDATVASRVRVVIRPLGHLPYDGLTLPLISPVGGRAAVQQGPFPSWETILALPGALPPLATLAIYEIRDSGRGDAEVRSAGPRRLALPLPRGVLLGRSADDRGFLVEAPQPDGSRAIGSVDWGTGQPTWLANDGMVNAHAVLGPDGAIAYTRRPPDAAGTELVYRPPGGGAEATVSDPGAAWWFPAFSSRTDRLYAFVGSPRGVRLVEFDIGAAAAGGPALSRRHEAALAPEDRGIVWAYQALVALQQPVPATGDLGDAKASGARAADAGRAGAQHAHSGNGDGFVFFHQGLGGVAVFGGGRIQLLASGALAGVRPAVPGERGYLLTSQERGLLYHIPRAEGARDADLRGAASLLSRPYIPRWTTHPELPIVLIGPGSGRDGPHLELVAMEWAFSGTIPSGSPSGSGR